MGRANVDADAAMPERGLKSVERAGGTGELRAAIFAAVRAAERR